MNILKILLAEIRYRKLNFLLSLFAVTIAVNLFVAGPVLVDGYGKETQVRMAELEKETTTELQRLEKQTRRLMRDMGFNLMIVHRDTNMSDFWAADFTTNDMPQEYVDRLAANRRLTMVTHLVATLQDRITWQNRKVLLVGYLPEATQWHMRRKAPMGFDVKPGTVLLGHELGGANKVGDTVEVLGGQFKIAKVLPEQGSKQDITVSMHLDDVQALLDKPGKINQIMALGCRCAAATLPKIRKQLAEVLPETRITEFRSIALARAEQRSLVEDKQKQILADMADSRTQVQQTMETLAAVITPVVVLACALWVGLLALANVRERRTEIGLLRALGKQSATIASLFLAKAVLLGLLGAVIGFLLGTWTAELLGTRALGVASGHFFVHYDVLLYAASGCPIAFRTSQLLADPDSLNARSGHRAPGCVSILTVVNNCGFVVKAQTVRRGVRKRGLAPSRAGFHEGFRFTDGACPLFRTANTEHRGKRGQAPRGYGFSRISGRYLLGASPHFPLTAYSLSKSYQLSAVRFESETFPDGGS